MSKTDTQLTQIAETLIARIEQIGELPWKRPWNPSINLQDKNAFTGRRYSGINSFVFEYSRLAKGYESNLWGTFATLKANGVSVKKGETATTGVIYRPVYEKDENGEKVYSRAFFGAMAFFNLCQTDAVITKMPDPEPIESDLDLKFYSSMSKIPTLTHGSSSAFYSPSRDLVSMPLLEAFHSHEEYVTTLAHELVHSTGHKARLGRFDKYSEDFDFQHREEYGFEELVAAIGEHLICRTLCVKFDPDNNAAYLKSWLKALKNDPKMIVRAASYAQKAHDYILPYAVNKEA